MANGPFGWTANDRSVIATYKVPGTRTRLAMRKGDVSVVLLDLFSWFAREIEPLDGSTLDDWGYAERLVRGSANVMSVHAIGGAGDLNALKHAMGRANTFTPVQRAKIRAKLREYGGVIRWGGDYKSRPDDMHFEINKGPAAVRVQADRIRNRGGSVATKEPTRPPKMEGAILQHHTSLPQKIKDQLGAVLTPETTTPDKIGRFNHFTGGSIYWSPDGVYAIYGRIRDAWARLGWEASTLGYPIGEEHDHPEGRQQHFARGILFWVKTKDEVWIQKIVQMS